MPLKRWQLPGLSDAQIAEVTTIANTTGTTTRASAPTVNDDGTAGFAVGNVIVNTALTPRRSYICVDTSTGAAVWTALGLAASLVATSGPWDVVVAAGAAITSSGTLV